MKRARPGMWLATGAEEHAKFLEETFDTIAKRFPDYDHSPFVNEPGFGAQISNVQK